MAETEDPARRGAALRTTDRLKALTSQALSRDAVASALATKLIGGGLGLVAFAAGVDYFGAGVQKTVEQLAADAGATGVAETVHQVDGWLAAIKAWVLAQLPDTPREVALTLASAGGVALLGWGLVLKLRAPDRGRAVRDVGHVLLGPGLLGALLFALRSWHEVAALRIPARGFVDKLRAGTIGGADVWAFTLRYGPWAWHAIAPVLVLGLLLVAVALALRPRPEERAALRIGRDVVRRTAAWGGGLALGFYALVTAVAVITYGSGITCLTWPWKVKPWASLATLGFMALGAGLVRTGRVLMREHAALGPATGPDPATPAGRREVS